MSLQKLLLVLIIAGAAVILLRKSGASSGSGNAKNTKVVHLVEETLQEHQGEDNPIVHAFEAALAQEPKV